MSKAEEAALKVYPKGPTVNMGYEDYDQFSKERSGYIQGFEQAEKDLALSWEDIPKLIELTGKTFRWFCDNNKPDVPLEELYEEVLRRFKEAKK